MTNNMVITKMVIIINYNFPQNAGGYQLKT